LKTTLPLPSFGFAQDRHGEPVPIFSGEVGSSKKKIVEGEVESLSWFLGELGGEVSLPRVYRMGQRGV